MIFRFIDWKKLYFIRFIFECTFLLLKNNSVIWLKTNKLLYEIHERVLNIKKKKEKKRIIYKIYLFNLHGILEILVLIFHIK